MRLWILFAVAMGNAKNIAPNDVRMRRIPERPARADEEGPSAR